MTRARRDVWDILGGTSLAGLIYFPSSWLLLILLLFVVVRRPPRSAFSFGAGFYATFLAIRYLSR